VEPHPNPNTESIVDELLKLSKSWTVLYQWQFLYDVWVLDFISGIDADSTQYRKEHVRLINQLKRIEELTREQLPHLLPSLKLPTFEISALPFDNEEIPNYWQMMNYYFGNLLTSQSLSSEDRKSGAKRDPQHEMILARTKELRLEGKTWKQVAKALKNELGRDDLDSEKVRNRFRGK
jgi:hypothetical protein